MPISLEQIKDWLTSSATWDDEDKPSDIALQKALAFIEGRLNPPPEFNYTPSREIVGAGCGNGTIAFQLTENTHATFWEDGDADYMILENGKIRTRVVLGKRGEVNG